jgi:hypothetical protein
MNVEQGSRRRGDTPRLRLAAVWSRTPRVLLGGLHSCRARLLFPEACCGAVVIAVSAAGPAPLSNQEKQEDKLTIESLVVYLCRLRRRC